MVYRGLLISWAIPEASVPIEAIFSDWMSWSRRSCSYCASFQTRSAAFPPRTSACGGLCWRMSVRMAASPVTSTIRLARSSAMRASTSVVVWIPRFRARRRPGASGLISAMPTISTSGLRVNSSSSAVPPLPAPTMMTRMVEGETSMGAALVVVLQRQPFFHRRRNGLQQLVFVHRLHQIIKHAAVEQVGRHFLVRIARRDDDRHRRVLLLEEGDGFQAVDLGHPDVADDDIQHEHVVIGADRLDAFPSVFGFHDVIARLGQRQTEDLPDVVLVVHDHDPTVSRPVLGVQSPRHMVLPSLDVTPMILTVERGKFCALRQG